MYKMEQIAVNKGHSHIKVGDYTNLWLTNHPTQNCQMFSLAPFSELLNYSVKEAKEIIKEIKYNYIIGQSLLLIDVNANWLDKVQKFDPIILTEYLSSNGSEMYLGIIDTRYF